MIWYMTALCGALLGPLLVSWLVLNHEIKEAEEYERRWRKIDRIHNLPRPSENDSGEN